MKIGEMVGDLTRAVLPPWNLSWSGIRSMWADSRLGLRFWPTRHPASEGSEVNFDVCRTYYRNGGDYNLGSGFAKPIVDLQVAFMGLPTITLENETQSQFLNECVTTYWVDEIQQIFRAAIRDSKVVVRISKPDVLDPLMTLDEAEHCAIEIIAPELVDFEYDPQNKKILKRVAVHHRLKFVTNDGDPAKGRDPITEVHDVLEIVTQENYRFFNQTTSQWIDSMTAPNPWGFVPFLEVWNEWDATLQGGMSDLETVIPFIKAFHDTLGQGLDAHKYHSTPKVVMNLIDIVPFIKNNFPEAVDPVTNSVKPYTEISWRGREMILLQKDEQISFLEANSILGDTKVLLEFLIDCICIASQTPEWAFMRVDSGSANSDRNAQTVPLVKKIERKRRNFTKSIQDLLKMVMVVNGGIPERALITWETIRPDDEVVQMQALQQLIMGLEVARDRGEISDETYQNTIRPYLPMMKSNKSEFSPPPPQPVLGPGLNPPAPSPKQITAGPQGQNE
jgi:hypothetical protein